MWIEKKKQIIMFNIFNNLSDFDSSKKIFLLKKKKLFFFPWTH